MVNYPISNSAVNIVMFGFEGEWVSFTLDKGCHRCYILRVRTEPFLFPDFAVIKFNSALYSFHVPELKIFPVNVNVIRPAMAHFCWCALSKFTLTEFGNSASAFQYEYLFQNPSTDIRNPIDGLRMSVHFGKLCNSQCYRSTKMRHYKPIFMI